MRPRTAARLEVVVSLARVAAGAGLLVWLDSPNYFTARWVMLSLRFRLWHEPPRRQTKVERPLSS